MRINKNSVLFLSTAKKNAEVDKGFLELQFTLAKENYDSDTLEWDENVELMWAFTWEDTPQGWDFWHKLWSGKGV